MKIDLELLKKFYVVVEEKSISRAARKLSMTQPGLSKAMSLFEYQLKMSLMHRSQKGIILTSDGEKLHNHAKKIISINDVFLNSLSRNDDEISGDLKIVTLPYLGVKWLPSKIEKFLELYPKVNLLISIKSENTNPINYDIGIGGYLYNQSRLIQKELFPDYTQIYASEKYLKKYGIPKVPEDLDSHNLITYKGKESYSEHRSINMLMHLGNTNPYSPRKPYLEIDSLEGMIERFCRICEMRI